ncbi:hypothetical protein [Thermococcus sp.]
MSTLKLTVRTYAKEAMGSIFFWEILGFLALSEAGIHYLYPKNQLPLVEFIQFLGMPLYLFLVFNVMFQENRVTAFEIALFAGWRDVAYGRFITALLSQAPFLAVNSLLLLVWGYDRVMWALIAMGLIYSGALLMVTLVGSKSGSYVLSMIFLFILPISGLALLQAQASLGNTVKGFMAYLVYILSPVYTAYAEGSGLLELSKRGLVLTVAMLTAILYVLYAFSFRFRNLRVS